MTDATVAALDRAIDFEETASVLAGGDGVRFTPAEAMERYRTELAARIDVAAERPAERGIDVLVSLELLDGSAVDAFERAGIAVVDKATYPEEDIYRLAKATGGTVVSKLDDLTPDRLGRADRVEQRRVGDTVRTVFAGCPGPAVRRPRGHVDAREAGIVEPRRTFSPAVETAAAIVERLLTVDRVLHPSVELYGYTPRSGRE